MLGKPRERKLWGKALSAEERALYVPLGPTGTYTQIKEQGERLVAFTAVFHYQEQREWGHTLMMSTEAPYGRHLVLVKADGDLPSILQEANVQVWGRVAPEPYLVGG